MNKILMSFVSLLSLTLLLAVAPAKAQNTPSSPATYNGAMSGPAFGMNAPGANYGLLGNTPGLNSWYLGYGTSLLTPATPALTWDTTPAVYSNGIFVLKVTQVGTGSGQSLGVNISTVIPATSSYETLISSGLNLLMTSVPTITTTGLTDGAYMILTSTDANATITLQDDGTLSGSKLELGAATRAITAKKTLTLVWQASLGKWLEISYGNN